MPPQSKITNYAKVSLHHTMLTNLSSPLVDCATLANAGDSVIILDCRHHLSTAGAGFADYQKGHIANAHHLDTDRDLSGATNGNNGRHPLPAADDCAQVFARCGINNDSTVVVYDSHSGPFAARCWWLLRWLGHNDVHILDGGISAWKNAGLPLSTTPPPAPAQVNFVSHPRHTLTVTATDILNRPPSTILLDARQKERWLGIVEPIDPVKGRIPKAINRPYEDNLQADGRFLPATVLQADLTALSVGEKTIHYCGSGITACHNILATQIAGLAMGQLYPGSWSEWCAHPDYPIETEIIA